MNTDSNQIKYTLMEYSIPLISKSLSEELDLAIVESEDNKNKFYTLSQIVTDFKENTKSQNA